MVWLVLMVLPVLVVGLAARRAVSFAWLWAGLAWLAALGWAADWAPALTVPTGRVCMPSLPSVTLLIEASRAVAL